MSAEDERCTGVISIMTFYDGLCPLRAYMQECDSITFWSLLTRVVNARKEDNGAGNPQQPKYL
jgi:hypothetical protein